MIILGEGPDGTGKTTLLTMLAQELGVEYEKFVKPESDQFVASVIDHLQHPEAYGWETDRIVDRWNYPSDVIYAPLMSGQASKLHVLMDQVEKDLIEHLDVTVLYITADLDVMRSRYDANGDEYVDWSQIEAAAMAYTQWRETTTLNVIDFDTTYGTVEDNFNKLLELVKPLLSKFEEDPICK